MHQCMTWCKTPHKKNKLTELFLQEPATAVWMRWHHHTCAQNRQPFYSSSSFFFFFNKIALFSFTQIHLPLSSKINRINHKVFTWPRSKNEQATWDVPGKSQSHPPNVNSTRWLTLSLTMLRVKKKNDHMKAGTQGTGTSSCSRIYRINNMHFIFPWLCCGWSVYNTRKYTN